MAQLALKAVIDEQCFCTYHFTVYTFEIGVIASRDSWVAQSWCRCWFWKVKDVLASEDLVVTMDGSRFASQFLSAYSSRSLRAVRIESKSMRISRPLVIIPLFSLACVFLLLPHRLESYSGDPSSKSFPSPRFRSHPSSSPFSPLEHSFVYITLILRILQPTAIGAVIAATLIHVSFPPLSFFIVMPIADFTYPIQSVQLLHE